MSTQVIIIGLVVGLANYLFRYLPLRLSSKTGSPVKQGATGTLLDSIGIASICALLVVSSAPAVIHNHQRLLATLVGFAILGLSFYKTRSIVLPTLLSALGYGLMWKLMAMI